MFIPDIPPSWIQALLGPVGSLAAGFLGAKIFLGLYVQKDTQLMESIQKNIEILSNESKACNERYSSLFNEFVRLRG